MKRRSFLLGLASALAAPAIVKAEILMPVKSIVCPPDAGWDFGAGEFTVDAFVRRNPSEDWILFAVDRDTAGKIRYYENGIRNDAIHAWAKDALRMTYGKWSGEIDEVRITKGVARYASGGRFSSVNMQLTG